MKRDFKQIAREMRLAVERAIILGPINEVDSRLKAVMDDFETSIASYADNEAAKRTVAYKEELNDITRPILYKESFNPRYGNITQAYIEFHDNERIASCKSCKLLSKSDERLPFFQKTQDIADSYYCGCCGFD